MGGVAKDRKGKEHILGVFEWEYKAKYLLTWGAKKYVYIDQNGKLHLTIAGVSKKAGALELERAGGINALLPDEFGRPEFIFYDAGGIEAVYNDYPEIKKYKVGNHIIDITPNVYLEQHPYTLSITPQYLKILESPDRWRDLLDNVNEV